MPRFLRGAMLAFGFSLLPAFAAAQPRNCELVQSEVARPFASPDGTRIVYVVRPVFRCSDGAEIRADSAVMFESTSYSQFFRNVYMRDGTRLLQADTANYQGRLGRLSAHGNVRVVDSADGTELTGDRLVYLRSGASRPEDIVTVEGGNPTATFTPEAARDSTGALVQGEPPRPVLLTARWIRLTGGSLVEGRGEAHLIRDSLDAYGDSLVFDQGPGILSLFGNARILALRAEGDTMDLRGDTVVVRMPGGDIEQLDSRGRARLLGTSVKILGPVIRLYFEDSELVRVVATVAALDSLASVKDLPVISPSIPIPGMVIDPARPEVTAQKYRITGDSVEVLTPGGQVSDIFSSGKARAVSTARDSLNAPDTPEVLLNDWIEGDSIRAFFELGPPPDGSDDMGEEVLQIRRLVATGNARSLSRFEPDSVPDAPDDATGRLNVNYVVGAEIRVFLVDGEVDNMEVDDAVGLFLQPLSRARVMGDTASSPFDSVGSGNVPVVPDTTGAPVRTIPPDTTRRPPPSSRSPMPTPKDAASRWPHSELQPTIRR